MAIRENNGGNGNNAVNVQYSQFLGMLFKASDRDLIAATVKECEVTEADTKKGFGTAASEKVRKALYAKGVKGLTISGQMGFVDTKQVKTSGGAEKPYLNVGLFDDEGSVFLSIPADADVAGALLRKLVHVQPGAVVEVSLFATKDGEYANHGASVKDVNGAQVPTIAFKDGPKPAVDAAINALPEAMRSDKEVAGKVKRSAIGSYNLGLIAKLKEATTAYREANKKSVPEQHTAQTPAPTGGVDFDDDIPF